MIDFGSRGDKEDVVVKSKTPQDSGEVFSEERIWPKQERPIDEYLETMLGRNITRRQTSDVTTSHEKGILLTIGTSGTSKTIQEEAIMSFESILPGILDNLMKKTRSAHLDRSVLNERLLLLAKRAPPDVLMSLTPYEIDRRIERILALENAISAFSELSPQQKKILEE